MRALTFQGRENIAYSTIEDPAIIDESDVIVKVRLCAICGSDLHVYHEHEKGIDHGTAMGHEFTGEIVETGRNVKQFRSGDVVMTPFTTSCGQCYYCLTGLTCRCLRGKLFGWREKGEGLHGGQAEYVRVPLADSTLKKIPDGVSLEEALLLGDVFSTGFYCAMQAGVKPGEACAVIGCGPVGLMTIFGARHFGAEVIFAIDTVEERLILAEKFGAIPLNPAKQNVSAFIAEATHGMGVQSAMEAVGKNSTLRLAWDIVRPGGVLSTVGVCTDEGFGFTPVDAYNKNLTLKIGRCPARTMMEMFLPVIVEKKYPVTDIITHRLDLSRGSLGYEMFAGRKEGCMKVVLTC